MAITSSALTNDPTPTITGTVEAGSTVAVSVDGVAVTDVVVTGTAWTASTAVSLGHGTHNVAVTATDSAGNTTTPAVTQSLIVDLIVPIIAINPGATDSTNDRTPTIAGSTDVTPGAGVTVSVSFDGGAALIALVQADGWNVTPSAQLAAGVHTVVATVSDPAGNLGTFTQTLTIDITAPTVVIDGGPARTTTDATPTITGSSADVAVGSPVTVTINGQTLTTTIAVGGTFSVTAATLTNDTHFAFVTVTDAAGNTGNANQALTVNAAAPTVTFSNGPTAFTNDTTPLIAGTTNAAAGSAVVVTAADQTLHTTVQPGGSWNVTAAHLNNGDVTVTAHITDSSGNTGSATQTLTIDTIAPTVIITGGATIQTTDPTPTISGTTDAADGRIITVTVASQTMTVPVTAGTWTVTASHINDGTYTATASLSSSDGNPGLATQVLTIDATAPAVAITSSALTNDPTPTISGTVEAGSTVAVSVDGVAVTDVVVTGTAWTASTAVSLGHGTHNVAVTATDSAANTTTPAVTQSLIVDLIVPIIAINPGATDSTNDRTPTIAGSTDVTPGAGVTVSVSFDGGAALTALVQADGWNVTPSAQLAAGVHTVVATVSDPAGNLGTFTQTLTIDITAPTVVIDGGPARTTTDATPTITGSSADVAVGSPVTVTINAQTLTTTIAVGGTFSVTAATLTNDTHFAFVTVTDAAGNTGNANQALTVNAIAPTVTITGGATIQTTDPTPTITGSGATPGSTVTITVAGQTMTTTVGPDGTWSVTPTTPLPAGANPVTVTITDPAGNTGTGTQTINVTPAPPTTQPPTTQPPTTQPPTTSPAVADYTSVGPKRVFDTRAGQSPNALRTVLKQQVSGGHELQVQMTDLAGYVPSSGVGAVSLNVTSTESKADGFITVYACGTRETVSSVNFSAGRTVANAVITPISPNGTVCFYANQATDIIVDINGWFAAGAAFNSVGPKRVFDTRPDNSPDALRTVAKAKLGANTMMEVRLTDLAGYVPANGVGSVSLNVVVTNPEASGFITVYTCGTLAQVSSVNYVSGQTVANAVIAPVSANGTVCFYSPATTDLIVDINGWIEAGSGFHAVDPARVLDTRPGESANAIRNVPSVKIGGGNILRSS